MQFKFKVLLLLLHVNMVMFTVINVAEYHKLLQDNYMNCICAVNICSSSLVTGTSACSQSLEGNWQFSVGRH